MLDAHCHIDLYPNPTHTALAAERAGVFTVLVTNLPSAFEAAFPNVQPFKMLRLALGLHPLTAEQHTDKEMALFRAHLSKTSFVGEVGLDFSREGLSTRDKQLESFRFVLQSLDNRPKFITVHSRQAEMAVLEMVRQEYRGPIVWHWYTGTHKVLDLALEAGHYFSINPAMTKSKRGLSILARIPCDRVLTESDGPFVKIGNRDAVPADVQLAERALAEIWETSHDAARQTIMANFNKIIEPIRLGGFSS